ncbi:hypothetical protein BpHYR1_035997 [Brachionus plicatilis]|uniref:Uncharacterized protein n=1 Tax=Brachionus plicatilis TaxID=10195 RepID=A0A3M7QQF4_BRAPC|nr:hypothetical protein BpHYR1_035997 [Brachionus plicatilis]
MCLLWGKQKKGRPCKHKKHLSQQPFTENFDEVEDERAQEPGEPWKIANGFKKSKKKLIFT